MLGRGVAAAQANGFWENKGQVTDQDGRRRDDVLFLFEQDGFTLALGKNFFSYQICSPEPANHNLQQQLRQNQQEPQEPVEELLLRFERTDVELTDASAAVRMVPSGLMDETRNIHNQNGAFTGIRQFSKVMYQDVYKGIDLVFYTVPEKGTGKSRLKYDFIVKDDANVSSIQLAYQGQALPDINMQGELISLLPQTGYIKESRPLSYFHEEQDSFFLAYQKSGAVVSFSPVEMKRKQMLTIDPEIVWSIYLGGVKDEFVEVLETDGSGNFYTCGQTYSPIGIVTAGAYQVTKKGSSDCFISKYSTDGSIKWSTYFGGDDGEFAFGMCQDGFGGLYVCGQTNSVSGIATDGAFQKTNGGQIDGFVSKFNTDGHLIWSTFLGGTGKDQAFAVIADQTGLYLCGYTESPGNIATSGADQEVYAGSGDAFIASFTLSGNLKYSTYLGGSDQDRAHDIHLDHFGNLLITGTTPSEDGIAMGDVHQSVVGGNSDAFVAQYSKDGHKKWGTYFGGLKTERGREIVPDGDGNCYVTGVTASGLNIATLNAHQVLLNGTGPATDTVYEDAYLAKFDSGGKLLWATYYGGDHDEMGAAIKWLASGLVMIGGTSKSDSLVSTPDAIQAKRGGGHDGFIAIFSEDGRLIWSTYFGGSEDEFYKDGYGPALDVFDNRYLLFGLSSYSPDLGTLNQYTPSSTSIPSSDALFLTIDLQCLDYYEPNNDIIASHDLGPIDQTVNIQALMNYQGDEDYYIFQKVSGLPLKVLLQNLEQNCNLILFDSLFHPIKKASHAGLGDEIMYVNAQVSGKFYLKVFSPGGGFSGTCYELSIGNPDELAKEELPENWETATFQVYPNPADGALNLQVYVTAAEESAVCISDLAGKLIQSNKIYLAEGENHFTIDVSTLMPGTYLVNFLNNTLQAQKVLIYR